MPAHSQRCQPTPRGASSPPKLPGPYAACRWGSCWPGSAGCQHRCCRGRGGGTAGSGCPGHPTGKPRTRRCYRSPRPRPPAQGTAGSCSGVPSPCGTRVGALKYWLGAQPVNRGCLLLKCPPGTSFLSSRRLGDEVKGNRIPNFQPNFYMLKQSIKHIPCLEHRAPHLSHRPSPKGPQRMGESSILQFSAAAALMPT